jgi:hypothetical protein
MKRKGVVSRQRVQIELMEMPIALQSNDPFGMALLASEWLSA